MTDPFFIVPIISRVTSFGAAAPGIKTPPINRSACVTASAMCALFEASVCTVPRKMSSSCRSRSRFVSRSVTRAPRPTAIFAAFVPTTPPPMMTTSPGSTPGTRPRRMQRPPPLVADRLVRHPDDFLLQQRRCEVRHRGEMEVREEELSVFEPLQVGIDRLFHLHDHLRLVVDGVGVGEDLRPRRDVLLV